LAFWFYFKRIRIKKTAHISLSEVHGTGRLFANFRKLEYLAWHSFHSVTESRTHTKISHNTKRMQPSPGQQKKTAATTQKWNAISCPQHTAPLPRHGPTAGQESAQQNKRRAFIRYVTQRIPMSAVQAPPRQYTARITLSPPPLFWYMELQTTLSLSYYYYYYLLQLCLHPVAVVRGKPAANRLSYGAAFFGDYPESWFFI
jgi:hypothetical protein